jgi:hypothetical protein
MARIGGAFPLPLAQVQEGGSKIELASGGVFYFPAGEYIVLNDTHTQIEYFDGQSQFWRIMYPVSAGGYLSADGYNFRARNIYGSASLTTISNAGAATATNGIGSAINGVSAAVAASDTTGYPTITLQTIVGGSVQAPTVTQAGSGFLVPPLIVIDPPPPGGIQATAYAVMTIAGSSGIATVTMDNVGAGYAASPNFWIIPQPASYQGGTQQGNVAGALPAPGLVSPANAVPGNQNLGLGTTGALLTSNALTGSGTLTGLIVDNAGGGYTTASPAVTFTGGGASIAATVTVTNNTNVRGVVLSQPRVQ